jgi:hypothetical protein
MSRQHRTPDSTRPRSADRQPTAGGSTAGGPTPTAETSAETNGPTETDGPTRASAAVVLFGTLAAATLLVTRVGPWLSLVVALGDALVFAASLWLVERERYRVLGYATAGLLALFAGTGFVLATGYASLQLLAALFPVTEPAMVQSRGLRVASATMVVFGGTVALVGAFSTVGNVLRADTAWDHARLAVKTFVVPLVVATLMLASTVIGHVEGEGSAPVLEPLFDGVDAGFGALLSPAPGRAHLFVFCALAFATALALERAVGALPIAELATNSEDDLAAAAESVRRGADRTALVMGALLPFSLVEFAVEPTALEGPLTPPVYGLLAAVTGAGVLRAVLVVTLAVSLVALSLSWSLRRISRTDTGDVAVELMPFVGGAGVVVLVALTHGTALDLAVEFVADRLPGSFATEFTRQSTAVVDFYGSLAVTLAVAALMVGLTALLSLLLTVVTSIGMVPRDTAAPALAAGGVFLAAAFAAGAGVGAPVVLAGLVAGFVVWDAGEYGTTLRRETGPNDRESGPESAHLGASVGVGVLGAFGALFVYEYAPAPAASAETLPFALVAVVAGLFLLVAALR